MSQLPPGANRLYLEKSPYLKQHAFNPVDWMPWGQEAFDKARAEDKPILLSIGYSTCHWCHVMERESFSDRNTALAMNQSLVCIKLDREERPEIDQVYMSAVVALTGQGGWPLNVFLTPQGKPFYGGTYFPPAPAFNRPSWLQLIEGVAKAWASEKTRLEILQESDQIGAAIESMGFAGPAEDSLKQAWLEEGYLTLLRHFDRQAGGFSPAPKFPMPSHQAFLLRYANRAKREGRADEAEQALSMVTETLRAMAKGGIHDHLGGGFARYSTDGEWHVPHFEKMLYDNGQLAMNYLEAFQATGEPLFEAVGRGILDYCLRDLRAPGGAFYSAEDADSLPPELAGHADDHEGHSHKAEGAFYVWTEAEIRDVLGPDAERFLAAYGVKPDGNVKQDPHGEFHGKNVLMLAQPGDHLDRGLAALRAKLLERRSTRPRPHRDEKVLASWNGMLISALCRGWQALGDPKYLQAAQEAAAFLWTELYDSPSKRLYRRWAGGERGIEAYADDHAWLALALLELYESDGNESHLDKADTLAELAWEHFVDEELGSVHSSRENADPLVPARMVDAQDNVEPSSASMLAELFLRLSLQLGELSLRARAEKILKAQGPYLSKSPRAVTRALCALDLALSPSLHAVVVGEGEMLSAIRKAWAPHRSIVALKPGQKSRLPFAESFTQIDGKPTAYICVDQACQLPTTEAAKAAALIQGS